MGVYFLNLLSVNKIQSFGFSWFGICQTSLKIVLFVNGSLDFVIVYS